MPSVVRARKMSLTGNLEDLPLLDILQIVSFSKKTGYLSINTPDGEGAIVFVDGFVVSTFTWDSLPIDPRVLTLSEAQRQVMIRSRIEMGLQQLIRLREGQFNFSLTEEIPQTIGVRDISAETLRHGINAQELLLDLARGMDEDRRDSTAALEASFAQPSEESFANVMPPERQPFETPPDDVEEAPEPVAPAVAPLGLTPVPAEADTPQEIRNVLLVDDEEEVRKVLMQQLTRMGYSVLEAEDPDSAVKRAQTLSRSGPFVLITDLRMPTSGGASFQGGFEVVKRLWKMGLRPPVLLMTESLTGAIQARAKQMGIANFVFKPGLSKLDPQQFEADLRAFARTLVGDVLPQLLPNHPLSAAPGAAPSAKVAPYRAAEDLARSFPELTEHLAALRDARDTGQISLLVMKAARIYLERGVLFLVKNELVRGLGGFGSSPGPEKLTLLVREVVVSLGEPSVFLDVVDRRKPLYGRAADDAWASTLVNRIGRLEAGECVLLPLLTNRECIALLYGDNPDSGRPLGRLEALEAFINLAGIALENIFLQRKEEQPA